MKTSSGSLPDSGVSVVESVRLLLRLHDLSDAAWAALDAGDTDGALAAVARRSTLLEQGRASIEHAVTLHAALGSEGIPPADGPDRDLSDALRKVLQHQTLLATRLKETGEGIAGELAQLDAGLRVTEAYRRSDRTGTSGRTG